MQRAPLTVRLLLDRMEEHSARKAVTTLRNGAFERRSHGEVVQRAQRAAAALRDAGVRAGDCVSTLLWNCPEHLELYLAVPAMGAVLHTVNLRLNASAVSGMLAETAPVVVVADESMGELLLEVVLPASVRAVVVVGNADAAGAAAAAGMPLLRYEDWLAGAPDAFAWPDLDEESACGVCYTSGTTGKAKGVVYSHRSTLLHAMAMLFADGIALRERDVCLPVVPMFHAQGWGFPYGACLCGADLALAYRVADPESLAQLVEHAQVTMATAVPTVWIGLLEALRTGRIDPARLRTLKRLPVGGAMVSADLIDGFAAFGIEVQHCWGMTEVSPLGLVSTRRSWLSDAQWVGKQRTPGVAQIGCELRIAGEGGVAAPHDGTTPGELQIRGPWVADAYFDPAAVDQRGGDSSFDTDAQGRRWLKTGDVATIDGDGYVRLVDRAKDLIKSGGEWISSLQLESALAAHPAVREAAVIAMPDARWQERPLAYVSLAAQWQGDAPDFGAFLAGQMPRWQVPDRFVVLPDLPKGATGKIDKLRLRELMRDALR